MLWIAMTNGEAAPLPKAKPGAPKLEVVHTITVENNSPRATERCPGACNARQGAYGNSFCLKPNL
jgi:hypothetical protein